jgi:glucan phosphorylase
VEKELEKQYANNDVRLIRVILNRISLVLEAEYVRKNYDELKEFYDEETMKRMLADYEKHMYILTKQERGDYKIN